MSQMFRFCIVALQSQEKKSRRMNKQFVVEDDLSLSSGGGR